MGKTRAELIIIYSECYPGCSLSIINALVDCYFDGFRDAIELNTR